MNWNVVLTDDGAAHDIQRQQGGVRQLPDHQAQPQDHRLLHKPHGRRVSRNILSYVSRKTGILEECVVILLFSPGCSQSVSDPSPRCPMPWSSTLVRVTTSSPPRAPSTWPPGPGDTASPTTWRWASWPALHMTHMTYMSCILGCVQSGR